MLANGTRCTFVGDAILDYPRNAKWPDALKIAGISSADEAFHHPSGFAIYDLPRV